MAYTMVLYRKTLSDGWTLPYVPADSMELDIDQSTDEFASVNKNYVVPTTVSPMSFGWSGIWPGRAARWANPKSRATPLAFRTWVDKLRSEREHVHCIVTDASGIKIVDGNFAITKFSYAPRRNGDVSITLEFKEYAMIKKSAGSGSNSGTAGGKTDTAAGTGNGTGSTVGGAVSGVLSNVTKKLYRVKIVNCAVLHIRKGPGTKYSVTGTLKKGAEAVIAGESKDGKWLKLLNEKGYISKAYTKKVTK